MEKKIYSIKEISATLEKILTSRTAIQMMYDVGISMGECKNLMKPTVPQIYQFIRRYLQGNNKFYFD